MKEYFVWLLKLITLLILIFIVLPLLILAALTGAEKAIGPQVGAGKNIVSVIELSGLIDNTKDVIEELFKQAKNPRIQGIVLRIDSPGGAVGPSQDLYTTVQKVKKMKPVVASMGSVAASGGLYAALGASKIYCQPGTITGSIGVVMQVPNFKKVADLVGVQMITIKSGALKDVGNSFRDMTEEERIFLQDTIGRAYADFLQAVIDSRGLPREEVLPFADGRPIVGSQARELKLVDDFGDVYDAARAVYDLLGKPLKTGEYPDLYYPMDKYGELKRLLRNVSAIPGLFSRKAELRYEMN